MYKLNPALKDFWLTKARLKALYGGRASSKSHDAAGISVFLAANYKLKFLCVRQFQNKISESVYTLLKDKIDASPFRADFKILKNSIINKKTGSEFLFYGIARNIDEIKSTEGVDICWLEESHALTEEQWLIIEPTIRKEGSEIWLIWNPQEVSDFVWQRFVVNPPPDSIQRQVNWDENPFLSETMLKIIKHMYEEDPKLAEHIYGGVPKTGSDKSFINLLYIKAAIDAHKHPTLGWDVSGTKRIGFDIADDGEDNNATVSCYGNVAFYVDEWFGLEDELLKSAARVYNAAASFGASITYDSIGVGAFAGSKFKELNDSQGLGIEYDAFNAGGRVDDPDEVYMELPHQNILNKDHFENIKAQKWDEVAMRFRKTYEYMTQGVKHDTSELISINSDTIDPEVLNKMCIEISTPRKSNSASGKFMVEKKEDMRKRQVKSPNIADAFIMAIMTPKRKAPGFWDL